MWTNKHRNWIEEGISLNWIDGVEHPNLKISNHTQYCNNKKEKNKKNYFFVFCFTQNLRKISKINDTFFFRLFKSKNRSQSKFNGFIYESSIRLQTTKSRFLHSCSLQTWFYSSIARGTDSAWGHKDENIH